VPFFRHGLAANTAGWDDPKPVGGEHRKANLARGREREDSLGNLVLLGLFVACVGVGIWLVNALLDARKADECMGQRRRDCSPISVPNLKR